MKLEIPRYKVRENKIEFFIKFVVIMKVMKHKKF